MGSKLLSATALAGVLVLAPTAGAHEAPVSKLRSCADVAFTPDSDDLAGNIRVRGLTCGLARDFIRDSGGRPPARFRGFRCTRRPVTEGQQLPYTRYRCTGAGDLIRWRRY